MDDPNETAAKEGSECGRGRQAGRGGCASDWWAAAAPECLTSSGWEEEQGAGDNGHRVQASVSSIGTARPYTDRLREIDFGDNN